MTLRATTLVRFACMLLGAAGCSGSDLPGEHPLGAETVVVRMPERLGALERPAVEFDHGKHSKALEQKCETCHPEVKPGELSLGTVRLENGGDRNALIDTYHDQCRGCHAKLSRAKQLTGPLMCGDCHVRRSRAIPARREIAFTPLHDLHLEVTDKNCATCHHHTQPDANPPPCKSCHDGAASADNKPSVKDAIHTRCIGCHHKMGAEEGCTACHEKAAKAVQG